MKEKSNEINENQKKKKDKRELGEQRMNTGSHFRG
jgi:hypothetical protein